MKPDLLGYLLHAVEPEEAHHLEELLEANPQWRTEAVKIRAALSPLELLENSTPSDELIYQTLRAVTTARVQNAQAVPIEPTRLSRSTSPIVPWKKQEFETAPSHWRRADAWALIAIVMLICLVIPPVLQYVRDRAIQTECRDNMRQVYSAFDNYMRDHHGHLPSLAATGPASHAGVYAVLLRDLGLWGESLKLGCPPTAQRLPPTMAEIQQHEEDEQAYWQNFAGNYAYSLGYLEKVHGKLINKTLKRSDGDSLPILADRPPRFGEVPQWATANSPNHSGRGQNVLQLGGNVQFLAYRSSPTGEDHDIFRNHNNQQNAGLKLQDIVLGASEARPLPTFISMD